MTKHANLILGVVALVLIAYAAISTHQDIERERQRIKPIKEHHLRQTNLNKAAFEAQVQAVVARTDLTFEQKLHLLNELDKKYADLTLELLNKALQDTYEISPPALRYH